MTGRSDGPVEDAVAAATRGRLIVLPTDTVYGVGTRPDDPEATRRVFAAKARPTDLELPVLVASPSDAEAIARFDDRGRSLAERFWPGPLTIVLPRARASAAWHLGGDAATIGIRMPRHPLALAVLRRTGPLAVTSANRSGEPPALTCDDAVAALGGSVEIYLCDGEPLAGSPSTVLDLAHGDARVLREGALTARELLAALGG